MTTTAGPGGAVPDQQRAAHVDLALDRECALFYGRAFAHELEALGGTRHKPGMPGFTPQDAEIYRLASIKAVARTDAYGAARRGEPYRDQRRDGQESDRGADEVGADAVGAGDDVHDRAEGLDDPVAARDGAEEEIADALERVDRWDHTAECDRDLLTEAGEEPTLADFIDHDTTAAAAALARPDSRAETTNQLAEPASSGRPPACPELDMPASMREHALATQAALAEGTLPPARRDDPAELVERLAQLQQRIAARGDSVDPAAQARREQLNRWHADDTADEQAGSADDDEQRGGDLDSAGWSR
jgi:hypothetical protein